MKYGLSGKQLGEIIEFIAQYPEVETATLFGSRALGTYKEASDVDIALHGEKVNFALAAKMKFNIEEDTSLPFFFDFIPYPTITHDALRKHIDTKGVVIFRRGGEWQKMKFSDFVELGKDQYKPDQNADFNYIGLEHIEQEKLRLNSVGHSSEITSNKFFFKAGDILFGKLRPYFRKVVRVNFDGVCSTDIWVIRAKSGFSQDFAFYFLANWEFVNTANGGEGGSRMPRADWNFLKDTEWLVPDLPEQKAIASVLSSLDDKIELLHRQNKTLEAMAETLFRQWFVEEAQEDWEEGRLGDVIELHYGKGLKTEGRTGTGFPVVGSSGIVDYHSEFLVEGPGIVMGRKGTLGRVIYLWDNFFPIDTTYYVKSKANSAGLLYEYFLLKTIGFEDMNTDSAVPGLNRDIALSTEIKIPPENRLHEFNELVANFVGKLKTNRDQIHSLEKLRDTLLPKLMNGDVRVAE